MRNTFIVTNMYVWCAILSPIFYHLWIYSGSANANFYFALSLVSLVAQVFITSTSFLTKVTLSTTKMNYMFFVI